MQAHKCQGDWELQARQAPKQAGDSVWSTALDQPQKACRTGCCRAAACGGGAGPLFWGAPRRPIRPSWWWRWVPLLGDPRPNTPPAATATECGARRPVTPRAGRRSGRSEPQPPDHTEYAASWAMRRGTTQRQSAEGKPPSRRPERTSGSMRGRPRGAAQELVDAIAGVSTQGPRRKRPARTLRW